MNEASSLETGLSAGEMGVEGEGPEIGRNGGVGGEGEEDVPEAVDILEVREGCRAGEMESVEAESTEAKKKEKSALRWWD